MPKTALTLIAAAATFAVSGGASAQDRQIPAHDLDRAAVQQHAAEAFGRIDANGDGRIDSADREARVKARFDRADADGDGAISYDEFTARSAGPGERPDHSGAEHRGPRGMRGMRGHAMGPRGLGPNADADSDGAISKAEFEAAIVARFDAADADGDGTVTAAERKAQRDAMRQQWRERRAARAG
jgi:hypothetical protein